MFARIKAYFAGAKQEFKNVHWPSWTETRRLTTVVIAISLGVAIFLGIFDFIFTLGLERIIGI